jgi:hypothetical protein
MTRIVTPLASDDGVNLFRQIVDDLAFSFIAPLRAH